MRSLFESYYPPSEEFFDTLWKDSLVVLDTNVLLDMYRYSEGTREDFLAQLRKVSDRLWLPHQVGLEFSRNRPGVIAEQVNMFQKAKGLLGSLRDSSSKEIEKILSFRLHPVLSRDEFKGAFEDPLAGLERKIEEYADAHPDHFKTDPILESILTLFDGKVGDPYTEERLAELYKEGKERYAKEIPPGYEDSRGPNKKEGDRAYGDLVLWQQIIDKAKADSAPAVMLISNDMKEDWWWFSKGKNLGCRPELREELRSSTGALFHIYTSERFLHYAPERTQIEVKKESIDEVRTLEEQSRKASEKATGAFASSLLQRILEDQRRREKLLSGVNTGGLAALIEQQRKRQEALDKILGSNIGQSGAVAKALDQIRKQEEARRQALGAIGGISSFKGLAGLYGSSLGALGGASLSEGTSDDDHSDLSEDESIDGEESDENKDG